MRDGRVKLYAVSEEEVLRRVLSPFPEIMGVKQHLELPKGYEIRSVFHDPETRAFMFEVFHPSFPEVQQFAKIPIVTMYDMKMVAYRVLPLNYSEMGEQH